MRRIFAVDNYHIKLKFLLKFGRLFHKKIPAGSADNVSNSQYSQKIRSFLPSINDNALMFADADQPTFNAKLPHIV